MGNFLSQPGAYTVLKEHALSSAYRRLLVFRQISTGNKPLRFIVGTVLISASFLVYLAYPVILGILPLGQSIKLAAVVAVWLLSWGAFSAGIFLAGPQGFERLKEVWSRMTRGISGKNTTAKHCRSNRAIR